MGATACGRELARRLSSHLQRRQGSGKGDPVLQVCGDKEVDVRNPSGSSRADDALEGDGRQRKRWHV